MRAEAAHPERKSTSATRAARWLWSALVAPPRRVDRVEGLVAVFLLAVLLAVVPVAAAAGSEVHASRAERAARESATRTPATATLLADSPMPIITGEGVLNPHTSSQPARWTTRDGTARIGRIEVVDGAVSGQDVAIWLDTGGNPVEPPTTAGEAAVVGVAVALGIIAAAALLLLGCSTAVRAALDRRRVREWAVEWTRVGPLWTRRTR